MADLIECAEEISAKRKARPEKSRPLLTYEKHQGQRYIQN